MPIKTPRTVELAGKKFELPMMCADCAPCCVVVSQDGENTLIADSKNPDQAPLNFTPQEMKAFIESVKAGQYDHLAK